MRSDPGFIAFQRRVGRRLRERREALEWTQEVAAAKVGVGWRHIRKIEAGEVNITLLTIFKFAVAYDFEADSILLANDGRTDDGSVRE